MSDAGGEQAIVARLTAIAERRRKAVAGDPYPFADIDFLSAHVETLTQQVVELKAAAKDDLRVMVEESEQLEQAEQENARLTADLIVAKESMRMMVENVKSLQLYGKQAEQARDTAHAALTEARGYVVAAIPHVGKLDDVLARIDAALAASAPQKPVGDYMNCPCPLCAKPPAPAQETERGR
jgi:hypothetical protein